MRRTISLPFRLYAWTAAMLAFFALALAACNGPSSSLSSPGSALPVSQFPASSSATPTPIPFSYKTVDDPNSNQNEVTGLNQLDKIVGSFGGGSGSNIPESYTSEPTYQKFRSTNYPGAQGTFATSVTSNKIVAGYVLSPPQLTGIWAFVRASGVWSLHKNHHEGTGNCAVTELLGINDSKIAVGFYEIDSGSGCKDIPFELNVQTEQFTDLKPPGAVQAAATGINGKGDISGWETLSSGKTVGWFAQTGTYYQIAYPGSNDTQATNLNWQDQIVGSYVDSAGTHGFILTYPTAGGAKRLWQVIGEPKAAGITVVTGINNHDDICGFYKDSNGNYDGFVATPQS